MKSTELRSGNLVYNTVDKEVYVITGQDIFDLEQGMDCFVFEPVQLTEEFKTEFGNDKLVLVDKSGFVIFKNGYAYQFVFEDYPYIHQLQNLYFALTGEELEINLNNK